MSVIVRGMEMPRSCWDCDIGPAFQLDNGHCPFYEMEGWEQENYQNKIADGCPISYVPPHGDLIDMDSEIDVYDRYDDDIIRPSTVRDLINDFISGKYPRTIIKAEE